MLRGTGLANQRKGRGEGGYSTGTAEIDLWRKADVSTLIHVWLSVRKEGRADGRGDLGRMIRRQQSTR